VTVLSAAKREAVPATAPRRPRRRLGDRLLLFYTWAIIVWLALPIAVMILFSFNDPHGRFNYTWVGFTLKWYGKDLFDYPSLTTAMGNSILVAVASTLISTALGTMVGLALGLGTIIVAHVMFCLSFVAVTVRARVLTLDPSLEEAARDLGAGAWDTFRLVTLPLIFPGVLSGALLAFAISIDDFVVTSFVSGSTQTFPLWIWSATRNGLPPQVDVLGTLIFVGGLLLAGMAALIGRRRAALVPRGLSPARGGSRFPARASARSACR